MAGYLEGEGSFLAVKRHGRLVYPRITATSTDGDVLPRVEALTGVGHVTGPLVPGNYGGLTHNHKPRWAWQVTQAEDAAWLMGVLLPLMCTRRAEAIRTALAAATPRERKRYATCRRCNSAKQHADRRRGAPSRRICG